MIDFVGAGQAELTNLPSLKNDYNEFKSIKHFNLYKAIGSTVPFRRVRLTKAFTNRDKSIPSTLHLGDNNLGPLCARFQYKVMLKRNE